MKKNNIHAGNVLIYSLVLVNLALLLSLAMFNNFFVFLTNTEGWNIDKKLSNNILGAIYCGANYRWVPYYIYFNPDFSWFSWALYYGDAVNLDSSWIAVRSFIDSDNSLLDISAWLPTSPDGVDDDFNSDNYNISATWSVFFPWNYIDDDALARTSIYGYISPQSEYSSILWTNTKTSNYIDANINNSDNYYDKIWNIHSWYLYLDADRNFNMKILQIDKNRYDTTNELVIISKKETIWIPASIGYIQSSSWALSLSWWLTGNEYVFDFVANDYAIFLDNTWSGVLTYVLTAENSSWSWAYLNPIDDTWASSIKYLWSEIIQHAENYIGKIFEVVSKK